jgi:cell wall-associated NlpC family hydrolase
MRHSITLLLAAAVFALAFSSCTSFKKFVNKDVEDEDFIISQLYADEYVEEKPFTPPKPVGTVTSTGKVGKLGIEITSSDNKKLYDAIEDWYGTPYKYGGCSKQGVDCSCFVGNVFKTVYGVALQRSAHGIYEQNSTAVSKDKLKEGDFVFFTNNNKRVSHVGIYLKDGMFAHSSTSRGVMISKLDNSYWKQHFFKGGRLKK